MSSGPEIHTVPVTEFFQNARVVIARETGQAVIIDPGGDADRLLEVLEKNGAECTAVWLTHSHLDHAAGVAALRRKLPFTLYGHPVEREMRARIPEIAALYGLDPARYEPCPEPDVMLSGGETVRVGPHRFRALFTPGHSPGHLCFYSAEAGVLLGGDALFEGSIGRTDLPGGDHDTLLRSIREQIFTLPEETAVLPGHGGDTTVGKERRTNPFLR